MHTTCSDGSNTYEEMIERALLLHLDFLAITDHAFDGLGPCPGKNKCDYELCRQVIKMCRAETRLVCIPGAELTGRLHVLALGIEHGIDASQPLKVQVEEIHRQGGLAIAAHPYKVPWKYTEDELLHTGLDAMECARGTAEENQRQWELADEFHIPCVYDTDAHYQGALGATFNVCSVPITSLDDLKAALLENKCWRG